VASHSGKMGDGTGLKRGEGVRYNLLERRALRKPRGTYPRDEEQEARRFCRKCGGLGEQECCKILEGERNNYFPPGVLLGVAH